MDDYEFTCDMTDGFRGTARWLFAEFTGRPVHYLEVGIFEGRSGCWMLDNVLTHPLATYTGIDLAEEGNDATAHEKALRNFVRHAGKYTIIKGDSSVVLPTIKRQFEMVYIDGGHAERQALPDMRDAWPLVAPGGIMLCDDYLHQDYGVKDAADKFASEFSPELAYSGWQIAWRK